MYTHPISIRICKSRKFNSLLRLVGLPRSIERNNVWIVAGAPRSGTTWLAETLGARIGAKMLDEPLNVGRYPELRSIPDFSGRMKLSEKDEHPQLHSHLDAAFRGQLPGLYTFPDEAVWRQLALYLTGSKLVVKMVRAGQLWPWLTARFKDCAGLVYIVRHPCAVIASQLRYKHGGGWSTKRVPSVDGVVADALPTNVLRRVKHTTAKASSVVEALAVQWCLDNYLPLAAGSASGNRIVITYEDLLLNPEQEMMRIINAIGHDNQKVRPGPINEPSHSVSEDLRSPTRQISKWKKQFTPDEVDAIMGIVEAFGLNLYTHDVRPHRPLAEDLAG